MNWPRFVRCVCWLAELQHDLDAILRVPDSLDRMVAVSYGNLALDQVAMGHTGRMVALQQGIYTTVPLDLVLASKKRVDVTALYDDQTYRPKVRDMLGKPMFLY